jgi:hypothetical protein
MGGISNTMKICQITVAPKVYIIEYVVTLAKTPHSHY